MRNIRTSLIVGVLVVELVFGVFLLLHRNHRATVDPDPATGSTAELTAVAPQSGDIHVTAGTVVGAAPLSANTAANIGTNTGTNTAKAAAGTQQSTSGTVMSASDSPVKSPVQVPRPATPAREPVAARAYAYVPPKTDVAPQTDTRRDGSHRRGVNPVGAAITDALVKESAKLDPALPPPTPSAQAVQPVQPTQPVEPTQASLDDLYRRGSNPVAAAMTQQLVKESAKLDPGLPPPNQASMK
jgi:hypothetical protein